MRFTALTFLALGASATAYVVNDKKIVNDNAVETRVVGSGPVRASALVAAMQARDPEPHHKGKGGKGLGLGLFGKRDVEIQARQEEFDQAADDAHWADLHTREPHHKGKGGQGGIGLGLGLGLFNKRDVEIEARQDEDDEEIDPAHWADLATREPHHKGKGGQGGKGLGLGLGLFNKRAVELEARQEEFDQAADDAHWADLHTRDAEVEAREPHHKGKGGQGGKGLGLGLGLFGKRAVEIETRQEFDQAADDAHWADLHARQPHHKGKGGKGGKGLGLGLF